MTAETARDRRRLSAPGVSALPPPRALAPSPLLTLALAALLSGLVSPSASRAALITVGPGCTLVDAVKSANTDSAVGGCAAGAGADVIHLPFGTYSIPAAHDGAANGNAFPPVSSVIALLGHGATIVRSLGTTPPFFRFFDVVDGGDLTLRDLTLQGGRLVGTIVAGGAVRATGNAGLTLDTVRLTGNSAEAIAGGSAQGGAVDVETGARVTVIDAVVSGNSVTAPSTVGAGGGLARGGGIYIDSDAGDVAIASSTIADNTANASSPSAIVGQSARFGMAQGGGLWVDTTRNVALRDSRVTGNAAVADGVGAGAGGVVQGGGIRFTSGSGNLDILRSAINGNTASASAGPDATGGDGGQVLGAGIRASTDGAVTVTDSSINHNAGTANGGAFIRANTLLTLNASGGGIFYVGHGALTLLRASVSGNTLSALSGPGRPGGGINGVGVRLDGGSLANPYEIALTSATLAGNAGVASGGTAMFPGFVRGGGMLGNDTGSVTILNSTITGNSVSGVPAAEGGGLMNTQDDRIQYVLRNSIFTDNTAAKGPNCLDSIVGPVGFVSLGNNILGSLQDCDLTTGPGDQLGASAGLGAFTDTGAPASGYFPLTAGSAAIDAGNLGACAAADQLGQGRAGGCDVGAIELVPTGVPLLASLLPIGRAGQLGASTLTAFASVINVGTAPAYQVRIAQGGALALANRPRATPGATSVPATFHFQTTDPQTNALTGSPDAPVDIAPGAVQTFVVSLRATAPFSPTDLALAYAGPNAAPAPAISGLSTLLVSAAVDSIADVIALAATISNDGVTRIPGPSGTGLFSVATINLGAPATITVRTSTGATAPAPTVFVCQTRPDTGECLAPPASAVSVAMGTNDTPTFAFFVAGNGAIALDPANHRVTVLYEDEQGEVRGATGVAVVTD